MRENFFCSIEDLFWQTGQARDVDSVTFVCAAGDDFAQENDLLVPFPHGDVSASRTVCAL